LWHDQQIRRQAPTLRDEEEANGPFKPKGQPVHIHHFQHVPFEGLGSMAPYLLSKGHQLSATHLYLEQTPPPIDTLDWLIVMGGPMGACDESRYTWMAMEKAYIQQAIEAGKVVLGICLGAQLIAAVLGARVFKNGHREIGWFPIRQAAPSKATPLGDIFAQPMEVFHWHGDTFEIPRGSALLASSDACVHQGFVMDNRVVGLQFHLETTPASARALIDNCGHELDNSRYVQSAKEILADGARFERINAVMAALLKGIQTCNS
jgi:GMP synthase-like glutamine amidotransferase